MPDISALAILWEHDPDTAIAGHSMEDHGQGMIAHTLSGNRFVRDNTDAEYHEAMNRAVEWLGEQGWFVTPERPGWRVTRVSPRGLGRVLVNNKPTRLEAVAAAVREVLDA